jgi:L-2-hydroxyglutarate oxidase LhgO
MAGKNPKAKIVPFRGEYFKINQDRSYLVNHLIYPVPDPKFPFLGVHFTRLIHGGIEAGPNAVLALSREGYKKTDFNFVDTMDSISFPGLWKFGTQHFSMCCHEILKSMSKSLFCKALQRLVPEVQLEDLSDGGAGVRAQAMTPNGKLEQDFVIERGDGVLHVLNAPSPGATASLAIADYLIHELTEHWDCFKGKVETSHE